MGYKLVSAAAILGHAGSLLLKLCNTGSAVGLASLLTSKLLKIFIRNDEVGNTPVGDNYLFWFFLCW